MRIMGIDPGTRRVGYGVIDKQGSQLCAVHFGTIQPPSKSSLHDRLKSIFEQLSAAIEKHSPDVVVIEEVFAGKGPRSSIKIGEGRGVALLCAALKNLPLAEYTATNVKMAVVGAGRASKDQVKKMVKVLLNLPNEPDEEDAADALAIAICHAHRTPPANGTKQG